VDYSKKSKEELIEELKFIKTKEENVSLVLNNIKEMFFHISFDQNDIKNIEYLSPHVEKVLGLTTNEYIEEFSKTNLIKYFHKDDVERLHKEAVKVTPLQKEYSFTYRFFNKLIDKYVWIEETTISIYRENGKKSAIFGTAKDVTEKIERERQLAFILDNVDECIYNVKFTSKGKKLTFISPHIKKLTGLSAKEFNEEGTSGKLTKRIHPSDVNKIKKNIEVNLYQKKNKKTYSAFRLIPKGSEKYKWIEETINAIYDNNGDLLETTTILRDITNKKIAEEFLKENEEKYRNLFSKNLAGVFITENNLIIDCNNSFAKIFGFNSRVELIGKHVDNLYFDKTDRNNFLKDLSKEKYLTNYKIKHKNKNGEEIWISTNVSIYNNKRIEGTLIDITEQVKIDLELKNSRENYKNLIENSLYATLIHIDGEIVYANKKAFEFLGLSNLEDLKGKLNIFDYLPKEYQEDALKRRKKVLKGKIIPFIELKIKKPLTGEIIDIETKSIAFDFQGKKAIQLVFQDITSQKQLNKEKLRAQIAEESNKLLQKEIIERKKVENELIKNQKYTKSIIDSSLDIICASDIKGNVIEFNNAAENAFGYKAKNILGKSIKLIYESKKQHLEVSKDLKSKGIFIGEIKNKKKNGEIFTSFLSASVLFNEDGKPVGSMGISRDITSLKEAENQLIESEEKYRDLFENASDLIQSLDMNGNIIYVNNSWKKTLGYTDKEVINKNIFEIIHVDCKDNCIQIFEEIKKSKEGDSNNISFELKTKNGEKIIVEGNVSLKFKNNKPVYTRAILRNVTEQKAKEELHTVYNEITKIITEKVESEDLYEGIRKVLEKVINTNVFSISYLIDKNTIDFPYYYDNTRGGKLKFEKRKKKKGLNEYLLKQKAANLLYKEDIQQLAKEKHIELIGPECESFAYVPLKIKNKVIGILSVQSYDNKDEFDKRTIEILKFISGAVALAVQRKYYITKIYEQSSRLRAIIENSTHLFWTYSLEKGLTSFNKNFINYIENSYNKKADLHNEDDEKVRFSSKNQYKFWDEKYDKTQKGKAQHFISKKENVDGEIIIKEVFLNPIYDENGEVLEISGIAHDITEKTISEQKLKESLKEKEILLKEVHHRVKNNLQVISSILNLQSSYLKDENTIEILKESQNRIKAMSFIHESLYQTTDFSKINFSDYVVSLSKNLVHSYGIYDNLIDLKTDTGNVSLSLDLSIPCGLILNELVSNALKYAFIDKKGIISIKLSEEKGLINFIIEDNGVGLPKNIDYKNTESLGLQLVMTLVEQINGKIELINKNGTTFKITFKNEQ